MGGQHYENYKSKLRRMRKDKTGLEKASDMKDQLHVLFIIVDADNLLNSLPPTYSYEEND